MVTSPRVTFQGNGCHPQDKTPRTTWSIAQSPISSQPSLRTTKYDNTRRDSVLTGLEFTTGNKFLFPDDKLGYS